MAPAFPLALGLLRQRWRRWQIRDACRFLPPLGTVRLGCSGGDGEAAAVSSSRAFCSSASAPLRRRSLRRRREASGWLLLEVAIHFLLWIILTGASAASAPAEEAERRRLPCLRFVVRRAGGLLGVRGDPGAATDPPLGCSSFGTSASMTSPGDFPSGVKMFARLRLRSGGAGARHQAILEFGFVVFPLFFLVIFFFGVGSAVILGC